MAGKIKTLFSDKEKTEPLFPRTKTSAVSADDGTGLDVLLDHVGYYDDSEGTGASVPIDADSLGGLPADNFASKDDLNAIDFPVDSVNGKTGAVVLSASDVGAAPDGYGLGKTQGFTITSGGDCNYARENGWYYVTGAPNAAREQDHVMLVASYGTNAVQQIAFMGSAFSSNTNIAVRKCSNGNWSEWEWMNPPMSPGVEYRTTERWYNGSPVYTQIVNLGTTTTDCSFNINISGLIALVRAVPSLSNTYCTDWDTDAGVHATNQFYFCPAKSSTGVVIYARCGSNYTGKTLIAQIWYTK